MYQNKPGTAIPDFTKLSIFYKNFLTGVWDPKPGARAPGGRGGVRGWGYPSRLSDRPKRRNKIKKIIQRTNTNEHSPPPCLICSPAALPASCLLALPDADCPAAGSKVRICTVLRTFTMSHCTTTTLFCCHSAQFPPLLSLIRQVICLFDA